MHRHGMHLFSTALNSSTVSFGRIPSCFAVIREARNHKEYGYKPQVGPKFPRGAYILVSSKGAQGSHLHSSAQGMYQIDKNMVPIEIPLLLEAQSFNLLMILAKS